MLTEYAMLLDMYQYIHGGLENNFDFKLENA